jgi:hypothetical protein
MRPSIALALASLAFSPSALAQASRPSRHASSPAPHAPATLSLVAARGTVEVRDPGGLPRPARAGDALTRGTRLSLGGDGFAVVSLPNGVSLTLLPGSCLTAFQNPAGHRPDATTLEAGTARVTSPASGARAFPLMIDTTTVFLGRGDGVVQSIPARHTMRISTHRGTIRAHYAGGDLAVRAGSGMSVEAGSRSHTHELLPSPRWTEPPPAETVTPGAPVDLAGTFDRASTQRVARWRTELSRDPSFRDLVAVREAQGPETRWEGRGLAPATWFVRVVALDRDLYESAPSAPARFVVRGPEVDAGDREGDARRLATVRVPQGILCGLDGAPLARVTTLVRLMPARPHRLRCASRVDGADAREVVIPATEAGAVRHEVDVRVTNIGEGIVTVRLADAEGYGLPYASVVMEGDGVSSEPLREADERGVYSAAIFWRGRTPPRFDLRFTVNGAVGFEARIERPGERLAAVTR